MKYARTRSKPMTMAITVIAGDEPKAIGTGPIMIRPPKFALDADNIVPANTNAKPVKIKYRPVLIISVIGFSF